MEGAAAMSVLHEEWAETEQHEKLGQAVDFVVLNSEKYANFKVLSISTMILPCYLVQQIPIIAFRLEKRS